MSFNLRQNRLVIGSLAATLFVLLFSDRSIKSELQYAGSRHPGGLDPKTILDKLEKEVPVKEKIVKEKEEEESHWKQVEIITPLDAPKNYKYGVIINTPKCGTGGIYDYFRLSFRCGDIESVLTKVDDTVPQAPVMGCPHGYAFQKSHKIEPSKAAIIKNQNLVHPDKCLIVSAIRDPTAFLPSQFMEKHRELCKQAQNKKHKPKDTLKLYREWLTLNPQYFYFDAIPLLLREFGAKSLRDEMEKIKANGGYSFLTHPSRFNTAAQDSKLSPFSNCDFLFLKLEDQDNWGSIFDHISVVPEYEHKVHYRKPKSTRESLCPDLTEHYRKIKNYQLSEQEKNHVINGNAFMKEWFQVYGR